MATDIIDTSIGLATLPATYTGLGTVAASCLNTGGVASSVSGFFTSDGNATQVNLGFRPTRIELVNVTDGLRWSWIRGMPVADSIKETLGTGAALDTGSALTPSEPATGMGNWIVTFSATACGTAKALSFLITG